MQKDSKAVKRDAARVIRNLVEKNAPIQFRSVLMNLHGVKVLMRFQSSHLASMVREKFQALTIQGTPEATLDWFDATCLTGIDAEVWDEDANPDLVIEKLNDDFIVTQRDFLGLSFKKEDHFAVACRPEINDGFYNSLRWFLPQFLLKKGNLVLHSSCIIDDKDQAHFFLGPSGAGKTTVAFLSNGRRVLGDDMNILVAVDGKLYAEKAVLGGNPMFDAPFGDRYPVAGFYWLQQSSEDKISTINTPTLAAKLISSLPLANWSTAPELQKLALEKTKVISHSTTGFNLNFTKSSNFWRLIDGF